MIGSPKKVRNSRQSAAWTGDGADDEATPWPDRPARSPVSDSDRGPPTGHRTITGPFTRAPVYEKPTMQSTAATPPKDIPDQELIRAAMRGEVTGFEQLTRRYQERLYAAMSNMIGCPNRAEDIVQDAFVRAFVALDTFRGDCAFYTWLYRIAVNVSRNQLRSCKAHDPLREVDRRRSADTDTSASPPERIERREERAQVRRALDRLDQPHREILILRELEGLDYQAIADILDVKIGTVRSRLARARSRLKYELTPYLHPDRTLRSCSQPDSTARRSNDRPARPR